MLGGKPDKDAAMDQPLSPAPPVSTRSATDQVFDVLYDRIISLELKPGTKVSEVEIARSLDVSRQPVRDAFYRLSKLGFIRIRPQRATVVTRISPPAVLQAKFIRTALELACLQAAMARITQADLDELAAMLSEQRHSVQAGERLAFQSQDDAFHRRICEIAGHGYVWSLIREQKAHMDRVRFLSLSFGAWSAYEDHVALLDLMRAGDLEAAEQRLRAHLGRIETIIEQIRSQHRTHFEEGN